MEKGLSVQSLLCKPPDNAAHVRGPCLKSRWFLLALAVTAIFSIFRIWYASRLPLLEVEAYYWL